jgi:hypothetical protein
MGPYIIVLPFTKTTEIPNSTSQSACTRNLETYLFGDVESYKTASDLIHSEVTYCNQIPSSLLYGPASPNNYAHQLHPRYTPEMLSTASPIIRNRVASIPSDAIDLNFGKIRIEAIKRVFYQKGSALMMLPVLAWGMWSIKRLFGVGFGVRWSWGG